MANVDGITLAICIEAVDNLIKKFETMMETDDNPAELQDLILTYEKAAIRLKGAYEEEWDETSNLPSYERIMGRLNNI